MMFFIPIAYFCLCHLGIIISGSGLESTIASIPLGCHISDDKIHGGVVVNCSSRGISSHDLPKLTNHGATTLILNKNNIGVIGNDSFQGMPNLVRLSLSGCGIHAIDHQAFRGIDKLQELGLSSNRLRFREDSLPFRVFDSLSRLEILILHENMYFESKGNYSDYLNIFDSAKKLKSLHIDSFSHLYIGNEFARLRYLESLFIICENMFHVSNMSLEGLTNSTVQNLSLVNGVRIFFNDFDVGVFNPVSNLNSLEINKFPIGNRRILKAMSGFQGKTINRLILRETAIVDYARAFDEFLDGYITHEMARFLSNVRVVHFAWAWSRIFGFDIDSFVSGLWRTCLKSVDLTGNTISHNQIDILKIVLMEKIEDIRFSSYDYPQKTVDFWHDCSVDFQSSKTLQSTALEEVKHLPYPPSLNLISPPPSSSFLPQTQILPILKTPNDTTELNGISYNIPIHADIPSTDLLRLRNNSYISNMLSRNYDITRLSMEGKGTQKRIRLPVTLRVLQLDNIAGYHEVSAVEVMGNNSLTEVYMRDVYRAFRLHHGAMKGVPHLKHVDLTGSKIETLESFFDFMPSLESLVLSGTQAVPNVLEESLDRMIMYNARLKYLDLSNNGLNYLPTGLFAHNTNIRFLSLASNRFNKIPFDLNLTPNLEILDLRSMSLSVLPDEERNSLDIHRKRVANFTVLLDKNAFVCTCSTLGFTTWLQSSLIRFDKMGNYSCIKDNGVRNYIGNLPGVESQLRLCQGRFYFMLSLVIASSIATVYMGVFVGTRYRKLVVSKVMKMVAPGFRFSTREDFPIDVTVGYSNSNRDILFVRYRLLPFLEEKWKLRTFIHHRDLLQDPLGQDHAIRDSWRCLLVITEDFLHGTEMSHHTMKTASFFVTPTNIKKVIVLVEDSVEYQIPDYVLQAIDEDNILVVSSIDNALDSETLGTLQNRIFE